MTIVLGSLLESIGHPVRLVVIGPTPRRPDLFTHIYLEVRHKDRWIALDPTMPHAMGWAPAAGVKRVVLLAPVPAPGPPALHRRERLPAASALVMSRRPAVVEVGRLRGLIYRSTGRGGAPGQTYIHLMQDPPQLMSSVDGRQLYIVGGRYRVGPRGIEG